MKKSLIILFLLIMSVSFSQENDSIKKDLKVGLVLAGGGAKGFAHIAILKALEEANVRIDYIGGTSMGAIVGALYASGYRATEIDSIIRSIDFEKLMQDEIPRKSKPFFEKENGENHIIGFPVRNGRVGLPKALSKGQNVLNLLTELLEHVDTISDFNKLPIPFVCIATNLETGSQEVLRGGYLPKAVRASSSFPTLLNPVEIDEMLLIDGGVVNNFPVEEVKSMGADIIIGIDLKSDYAKREDLNSVLAILDQIIGFQMYGNEKYKNAINETDLYIHPNLNDFGVTSFDKYDEIYKVGEDMAKTKLDEFAKIAQQQSGTRPQFIIKKHPNEVVVSSIEIEGNQDYTNKYVKGKMGISLQDTITYSDLLDGINNLSATENFTDIQYQILENDGESIVKLKLKQDDVSTYISLAAHYDDLYKTAVLVNFTSKHLLIKNDILSADLILGDNIRYNLNYFIDNGSNWSIGLFSRYNSFETDVDFEFDPNINKVNFNYRDFTNRLYIQTVFNRRFALGIGAEHKKITAFTRTFLTKSNDDKSYFDKSDYGSFISYLKFDSYDKKYFQKKGAYLEADFRWYLFSSDYHDNFEGFSQLKGKFGYAYTFFDKLTLHFIAEAGFTIGENENEILNYHIGGYGENFINTFVPLIGYDYASSSDDGFVLSLLEVRYELFKNNYLSAVANAARVDSQLFNEGRIFEDTKIGFGLGYGIDSFLGPIEINYTYSPDTGFNYWYFNLGFWF